MDYLLSADFIAGWIGGSIGIIATQPLDTIRIRTQLYKGSKPLSITQHAISIVKHEGMHGLFRGVASPSLTVGLMSAILFQAFESSKNVIQNIKYQYGYKMDTTYPDMIIAGGIAGVISCIITAPTELIKIEVQKTNEPGTETIRHELKTGWNILKRHGFFNGIYRGFWVTVSRDSIAFMSYFPCYEYLMRKFDIDRETEIVPFIGGGIAGLVSWFMAYPFDYIKTYHQTKSLQYGEKPFLEALKYHYKKENGIRAFYTGCRATLIRATPQHAIVFVCYEKVKSAMNDLNNNGLRDYGTSNNILI
eukprot:CAMPEP_0114664354 /NCGR_PEP_ID=MMETSP0191-20121206/28684_1 /TAXON_ID=126664 /ORGANISM="Sorites sp." /LENGTH=304 /DNA_ID=CAMNT_0001906333 /DNA_START=22 /DNA_END=936 /DNA_ORIENTATION=-